MNTYWHIGRLAVEGEKAREWYIKGKGLINIKLQKHIKSILLKHYLSYIQYFLRYPYSNTPLPPLNNVPTKGFSS
jgi:hypothetical protein